VANSLGVSVSEMEREFALHIEHALHVGADEYHGWVDELKQFNGNLERTVQELLLSRNNWVFEHGRPVSPKAETL